MNASQSTRHMRRTILRFALKSILVDERPNVYKDPQLVLKPQLELPPRRPYTGSRPRVPLWRHFLMVHVKDKAEELVKFDLSGFKKVQSAIDPTLQHWVRCSPPEHSFIFQYANELEKGSHILRVTLQNRADFEAVFREFEALGLDIVYEHQDSQVQSHATSRSPAGDQGMPDRIPWVLRSLGEVSNLAPRPAAPPDIGAGLSATRSSLYPATIYRPPSQPVGLSASSRLGQGGLSPATVPSRPATTIGLPGVLGQGIYKVSKLGYGSFGRPMVRTPTMLGGQGPRLYTVSKHFDKTIDRRDIYLARRRSSGAGPDGPGLGLSENPSLMSSQPERTYEPARQYLGALQLQARPSSDMGAASRNTQNRSRPSWLHRTDNSLDPAREYYPWTQFVPAPAVNTGNQPFPSSAAEDAVGMVSSQESTAVNDDSVGDYCDIDHGNDLLEVLDRQELGENWLLQLFQIQHEGLCEAGRIWDELLAKGAADSASAKGPEELVRILSKFEGEFVKSWDAIVSTTARKMREVQAQKLTLSDVK